MKALQIILLLLGGAAFGGILLVIADRRATPSTAASGTNMVVAVAGDHDQPGPAPAFPVETQGAIEAARRPMNDALPPRPVPPAPTPGMPSQPSMPVRTRTVEVVLPPTEITPSATGLTNATPLRRLGINDPFAVARERMVLEQLAGRNISNPAVLNAMRRVPRHQFVDSQSLSNSYVDMTLVLPDGVILETPYVIALTAVQLATQPGDRVLDVEPGTGYDAAVFSRLVKEVYVTESVLAERTRFNLECLGFTNNISVRLAEVAAGWPEAAPFDTIVFNYPLAQFPNALLNQLKPGGRVIIPAGPDGNLSVLRKSGTQLAVQFTLPVRPPPIPGNVVEMHVLPVRLRPSP